MCYNSGNINRFLQSSCSFITLYFVSCLSEIIIVLKCSVTHLSNLCAHDVFFLQHLTWWANTKGKCITNWGLFDNDLHHCFTVTHNPPLTIKLSYYDCISCCASTMGKTSNTIYYSPLNYNTSINLPYIHHWPTIVPSFTIHHWATIHYPPLTNHTSTIDLPFTIHHWPTIGYPPLTYHTSTIDLPFTIHHWVYGG